MWCRPGRAARWHSSHRRTSSFLHRSTCARERKGLFLKRKWPRRSHADRAPFCPPAAGPSLFYFCGVEPDPTTRRYSLGLYLSRSTRRVSSSQSVTSSRDFTPKRQYRGFRGLLAQSFSNFLGRNQSKIFAKIETKIQKRTLSEFRIRPSTF